MALLLHSHLHEGERALGGGHDLHAGLLIVGVDFVEGFPRVVLARGEIYLGFDVHKGFNSG